MGRPSQPAGLLLLTGRGNGTDSGGRKVRKPPEFRRIAPKPPTWLSREASAEWKRVVPGMTRLDLLKEEDRAVLAAYCETWSVFVAASRSIKERGLVVDSTTTTRSGDVISKPMANPAVSVARNAGRELRAFAGQFGLSPAAEMALGKAAEDGSEGDNPFS